MTDDRNVLAAAARGGRVRRAKAGEFVPAPGSKKLSVGVLFHMPAAEHRQLRLLAVGEDVPLTAIMQRLVVRFMETPALQEEILAEARASELGR